MGANHCGSRFNSKPEVADVGFGVMGEQDRLAQRVRNSDLNQRTIRGVKAFITWTNPHKNETSLLNLPFATMKDAARAEIITSTNTGGCMCVISMGAPMVTPDKKWASVREA